MAAISLSESLELSASFRVTKHQYIFSSCHQIVSLIYFLVVALLMTLQPRLHINLEVYLNPDPVRYSLMYNIIIIICCAVYPLSSFRIISRRRYHHCIHALRLTV